jgi:hypothetical protein
LGEGQVVHFDSLAVHRAHLPHAGAKKPFSRIEKHHSSQRYRIDYHGAISKVTGQLHVLGSIGPEDSTVQ